MEAEAEDVDTTTSEKGGAIVESNGVGINGVGINGVGINGVSINGVSINGVGINGVSINGTGLTGTSQGGSTLGPASFTGADFTASLADGTTVALRISAAALSATDPDIWLYTVLYEENGAWKALCGLDASSQPIPMIAHTGRWDASVETSTGGDWINDASLFTLACRGSTVAKCTELGYKPWKTIQECDGSTCQTHSLRSWHQACTRMIRADYCGNGKSLTHNGVFIDIWDQFGIQTETQTPDVDDWYEDAEWSPEGSVCIKKFRLNKNLGSKAYVQQHCPDKDSPSQCFKNKSTFFTANGFSTPLTERSLLRNTSKHGP